MENEILTWQEFIESIFENSNNYKLFTEERNGSLITETYHALDIENNTKIIIEYFAGSLLSLVFWNPICLGFNEQQKTEYFYKYDFTPDKSYGGAGLDFTEKNKTEIKKQLLQGLNGKEIQYYNKDEIIKSEISIFYNEFGDSYNNTIFFEKKNILRNLLEFYSFIKPKKKVTKIKEIDLKYIFSGI